MTPLFWLIATWILSISGAVCTQYERNSRGKGTWYIDRELLVLSGAFYALSMVCAAMAIESALFR